MLVYNNATFVKTAIESVLTQTYTNWELLLNDDGSTDGAWDIAVDYANKDERIKIYQRKPEEKPTDGWAIASNRLHAYNRSSGELVCHLDGDDALYPYSLEYMVKHFIDNPEDGIAYSDFAWLDGSDNVFGYHKNENYTSNLSKVSWRHFGMFRKSAYKSTDGYNLALNGVCEDVDLFMQIVEKHKFNRVPQVLYKYRAYGGNVTHTNKITCQTCTNKNKCNFIRVWAKHFNPNFDPLTWSWRA